MAELRPVFTITYGSGLPLPIQVTGIVPRPFQVGDQKQISKVIREIMPPDAMVIIDTGAFQGHSINARDYAKAIRAAHEEEPLILFLRYGIPSDNTIEGDQLAGATDVLYHSALTEASDIQRMNHFIREGVLPPPLERKRSSGNVAGVINALNRRANYASEPTGNDAGIPSPGFHEKPSPPGKSGVRHVATTQSKTPPLGDREMETSLATLRAITEQNAQILAALEGIQEGIRNLLTRQKGERLAEAQAKVNDVFAHLRGTIRIPAKETSASNGTTADATTGVNDATGPGIPPKEARSFASLTKHGREGDVELLGIEISLPYAAAELFYYLISTGKTMGVKDVSAHFEIGTQGAYVRICNLRDGLEKARGGLSSCLTPVKNGKSIRYRFDEIAFRKAFGMK